MRLLSALQKFFFFFLESHAPKRALQLLFLTTRRIHDYKQGQKRRANLEAGILAGAERILFKQKKSDSFAFGLVVLAVFLDCHRRIEVT